MVVITDEMQKREPSVDRKRTTKPLSERIQAAIKAGKSQGVESLIFEAEAASKQAVADHGAARERALDPLLSEGEIAAARKAMEDASFVQERMTKAAAVLREKLAEFKGAEEQNELRKIYDAAVAKRDAASARLKAEYSVLANKLGALLSEVATADHEVDVANRRLPDDADQIIGVERHARPAVIHWRSGQPTIPGQDASAQFLTRTNIPAFTCGRREPIWGPDGSISGTRIYTPETPNAEEAKSSAKAASKTGEAPASGGDVSPVSSLKEEAA